MIDDICPSAQDLVDALSTTCDREVPGGTWCAPGDGEKLRRLIGARSRQVNGLVRQSVRLSRLLSLVGQRSYIDTLYRDLPTLRSRHFHTLAQRAGASGQTNSRIHIENDRVIFLESDMNSKSVQFDLTFGQMPMAAAFLDFFHNAIGFKAAGQILAPVLGLTPTEHAETVSRRLERTLNEWLDGRLASEHHLRQARVIRDFLKDYAQPDIRIDADLIDDEAVLAFWVAQEASGDSFGFRLFRSAARAMISFWSAIRLAVHEEVATGTLDSDTFEISEGLEVCDWHSPLKIMFRPNADKVKWLTRVDRDDISMLIDDGDGKNSLFIAERPDKRFFLTFIRYVVFGRWQNVFVEHNKRRLHPPVIAKSDNYDQLAQRFQTLLYTLSLLSEAAAWALALRRHPSSIVLLHEIDPRWVELNIGIIRKEANNEDAIEDGVITFGIDEKVIARLVLAKLDIPADPLGQRLRTAYRAVNRIGFRPVDEHDVDVGEALACGSDAVMALWHEISRFCDWSKSRNLAVWYAKDFKLFQEAFNALYALKSDNIETRAEG